MKHNPTPFLPRAVARHVIRWILLTTPVAAAVGSACAFFLWSLDHVTAWRGRRPALLFALPALGVVVHFLYARWGGGANRGNDLLIEQIHTPGKGVPRRMAPLILIGTLITHLGGGSSGREGTAVQMGGGMASFFARLFKLHAADARTLLMAGVAAGFGGVFGTPIAGTVFTLEVAVLGRLDYEPLVPCLWGAVVGHWACLVWGTHHTNYHQFLAAAPALSPAMAGKVLIAAVAFGLSAAFFVAVAHGVRSFFQRRFHRDWLRPVLGGLALILLSLLLGTRDYLGLGVDAPAGDPGAVTILSAFHAGGATPWSWFWKTLFTALTLGAGFKGGEVTPLFFVGATLGNALAVLLSAPVDLFAGLGFVAVFAAAANTPLAGVVLGLELFGKENAVYFALAVFVAYAFSGHTGIYASQRLATPKNAGDKNLGR